jgi:hypothetical protein
VAQEKRHHRGSGLRERWPTADSVSGMAGSVLAQSTSLSSLSGATIPVLVPGPGQPFADQTPTSVSSTNTGYTIEYGPTVKLL